MKNSPNPAFAECVKHSKAKENDKAQLTVRTEQWIVDAIQDDAKRNGLDPSQLNVVMNRALKQFVTERGYTEPPEAPDYDEVCGDVSRLVAHDQHAALRLLQHITEALTGAAKIRAVLIA
jgi:hypothetical protein